MSEEKLQAVVTAYRVGTPDSVVVVIPKPVREALQIPIGAKLSVKTDAKGRIIYEVIPGEKTQKEAGGVGVEGRSR